MIASPPCVFVALAVTPRAGGEADPDALRERLVALEGVEGVRPDLPRGRVHVLYDGRPVTLKTAVKTLRRLGFEVHVPGYIWHSRAACP